jgi:hypothetical protein
MRRPQAVENLGEKLARMFEEPTKRLRAVKPCGRDERFQGQAPRHLGPEAVQLRYFGEVWALSTTAEDGPLFDG